MMFAVCDPKITWEAQVALILKVLCGFSSKEIARAFLTNESTINKRLYRSKLKLRNGNFSLKKVPQKELEKRLDAVLKAIYLLFNEGYNSISEEKIIRKDLCLEAMRLCYLLSEKPIIKNDKIWALMALMCYHGARFEARLSSCGELITMENQDWNLWNKELIIQGDFYMNLLNTNNTSRYHLEAGISSFYCHSKSYKEINWVGILVFYDQLILLNASPIIKLNRAVIVGKVHGPHKGIEELLNLKMLKKHHLYHSILGAFYKESNQLDKSEDHFLQALKLAPTNTEKKLIQKRLLEIKK